jgi:hypothetical protein
MTLTTTALAYRHVPVQPNIRPNGRRQKNHDVCVNAPTMLNAAPLRSDEPRFSR